ncbi:MAG: FAD-binding oxidoreductase, partial [Actinobacteria bacterium]|nr:FAD-binding oxidoreductase [Actinomycetota bacterium]
ASHARGKAYRDVIRALHGVLGAAPDVVLRPRDEADVVAVLDWATDADVAVVPYGGGSSVVGGVECDGAGHAGVASLDLGALDRVVEVDPTSRAARVQAGVLGPHLEDQLRPHGLTLRHFPQSFEFSTLGGWIATRAGGHYATLRTHIDDLVESLRVVTPIGVSESWRLPGSGAGPSPDRLFLGSEGILGVVTEAWIRLQDRPEHRGSTTATFADATSALDATREIAQSGLHPANCRLLDPGEAALSGAGAGDRWVLVLGVESAWRPLDAEIALLADIARSHRGDVAAPTVTGPSPGERGSAGPVGGRGVAGDRDAAADAWRSAFLRMPYRRDGLARMSALVETFETATTWDRIGALIEDVRDEVGDAIARITGADGLITWRLTHAYPDGAAPYFTVIAAARRGSELAMWDEVKAAAMEVLVSHRATVTHHHAVGRDHRPGYDRQRPQPFASALVEAKRALDPAGILNPGVLVDA